MSAESVLREAVDDHRRELAALQARVKELEAENESLVDALKESGRQHYATAMRILGLEERP